MLENFLSKLGASTRITVGVSVSPGIGLEMIEIDRSTGSVTKYASKPLDYNNSSREITDYEQFKNSLEDLFEELRIPKKSNVILSLPNVHFGMINLPLLLTDEAITNAIISEVEQSYIFKRQDPVVTWSEVSSNSSSENRMLAYTAIQKEALEQITEICEDIGCKLAGLENSYSSLFRALNFLGSTKEQMKENCSWNLMVIMQNNYSIISMSGKKVIEYYEEPLALKSFVDDEIYNAIKTSAQITLSGLPANYLFIISETDLVSAEVLAMKISSDCPVNFMECNKYIQNELLPISLDILPKNALQVSLEAIGTAVSTFSEYPVKLNFVKSQEGGFGLLGDSEECPKIHVGNLEVELTPDFIKKLSLIIGAILIVPLIILYFMISIVVLPKEKAKLDGINAKISSLNQEIDKYKDTSEETAFDAKTAISNIIKNNESILTYYSAIGISIPNSLWLTSYKLNGDGKIDITGEATNVKSIYIFYKNLKEMVNNSDVRLYKLEIESGSIDDIIIDSSAGKLYQFEITNMTEQELNPEAKQTDTTGANAPTEEKKSTTFTFGKPLFGQKNEGDAGQSAGGEAPPPAQSTQEQPPSAQQNQSSPPATSGGEQLPANLKKIEKF